MKPISIRAGQSTGCIPALSRVVPLVLAGVLLLACRAHASEPAAPAAVALPPAERIEALVTDMANTQALWSLYRQKSYADAAAMARPLAEQGSASAQFVLAVLNADRLVEPADTAAAAIWLKQAAEQELPDAWDRMAADFRRGELNAESRTRVRGALARSAAANIALARYQAERTNPSQFATRPGDGAARRYWDERERYFTKLAQLYSEGRPLNAPAPQQIKRLSTECRPLRAPVAQMRRLGLVRLEGFVDLYIGSNQRVDGVAIGEVSDERLRLLAFDLFNNALHGENCVLAGMPEVNVRIPFRFVLN